MILGNGIQSEGGCQYEAMIWNETGLVLSGEFNGWLKQESTLANGISFDNGFLRWTGESHSENRGETHSKYAFRATL